MAHTHKLKLVERDNGWKCDASNTPNGCLSGMTDFYQSKGIKRFRCHKCDYDLCDKCYEKSKYKSPFHRHSLTPNLKGKEMWKCDGISMIPGGCKRGIKDMGLFPEIQKFRCEQCNFNFCDLCLFSICHVHELEKFDCDNGWLCNGKTFPSGCLSGLTDFRQSTGIPRYRCKKCDFDLCDKCYAKNAICSPTHEHFLYPCFRDNGWSCNGIYFPGGCKSGITDYYQSFGMKRYRCNKCDFDLCDKCLHSRVFYANDVEEIEEPIEELACIICLENKKSASLIHINAGISHNVCCMTCATILRDGDGTCPVCREPIDMILRHYS